MMRTLCLLALVACGTETDTDPDSCETGNCGETDTGDGGDQCDLSVVSVTPMDDAVDVGRDVAVVVTLSEAAEGADIYLAKPNQDIVPATLSVSDNEYTVVPGDLLDAFQRYFVFVEGTCMDSGMAISEFRTGETGGGVENPEDLVGNVYGLDLGSATLSPSGLATLLNQLGVPLDIDLLVEVSGYDSGANTLDFLGAIGEDSETQDMCQPTLDLSPTPASFASNPQFTASADSLPLDLGFASVVTLESVSLTGTFLPDGETMRDISFSGALDLRSIEDALPGNITTTCALAGLAGANCSACADGEVACIEASFTGIDGHLVDGLDLVPLTQAEAANCGN